MTCGWNRCRWTRAILTSCARRNCPGAPAPGRRRLAAPDVPTAPDVPAAPGAPPAEAAALAHRVRAGGDRVVPLGADRAGERAARIFARLEQVQHMAEVKD